MLKTMISCILFVLCCRAVMADFSPLYQERLAMPGASAVECEKLLESPEAPIRRLAFQRLLEFPELREKVIATGLRHPDEAIRRYSLRELVRMRGAAGTAPQLKKMAGEDAPGVREFIAAIVQRIDNEALRLELARELKVFPFERNKLRLRDNPTYDHDVSVINRIALPNKNWRFTTDPADEGHLKGFFRPDFNDKAWMSVQRGPWNKQGAGEYTGTAWYRIPFRLAAIPQNAAAAELKFGQVADEAWVWVNGKYIGQHALGASGWFQPFNLDVTEELRWNSDNLLVVRVKASPWGSWHRIGAGRNINKYQGGGIYSTISIEILK